MGTGLYIVTENEGATVGIREGWNVKNSWRRDAVWVKKLGQLRGYSPPKLNNYTKARDDS